MLVVVFGLVLTTTVVALAVGSPAVGSPAVGSPAVGSPAVGSQAVGSPAVGSQAVGGALLTFQECDAGLQERDAGLQQVFLHCSIGPTVHCLTCSCDCSLPELTFAVHH